jgi:hypothetical protein
VLVSGTCRETCGSGDVFADLREFEGVGSGRDARCFEPELKVDFRDFVLEGHGRKACVYEFDCSMASKSREVLCCLAVNYVQLRS